MHHLSIPEHPILLQFSSFRALQFGPVCFMDERALNYIQQQKTTETIFKCEQQQIPSVHSEYSFRSQTNAKLNSVLFFPENKIFKGNVNRETFNFTSKATCLLLRIKMKIPNQLYFQHEVCPFMPGWKKFLCQHPPCNNSGTGRNMNALKASFHDLGGNASPTRSSELGSPSSCLHPYHLSRHF